VVVQVVAGAVAAGVVPARWCSGGRRQLFFLFFVFEKTFVES
jgi:hypothetical protein